MDGYLSFNVSFYFRIFNYCLKNNWDTKEEEKKTICIIVNTIFDKHLKDEKKYV